MNKLTGLVVCGGQSSRMGTDKSLLDYHGKPQRYYLYEWLHEFCEEVYISCNATQAVDIPASYKTIVDKDKWKDMGPMTGLLSAHAMLQGANILAIGCDYPLLATEDVKLLIDTFLKENKSVAYTNEEGFIEPLVAVYKQADLAQLSEHVQEFNGSLNRFLQRSNAVILTPVVVERLKSVDTQEDYELIKKGGVL